MKLFLYYFKRNLFFVISVVMYGSCMYYLYIREHLLISLIFTLILFVAIHYYILLFKDIKLKIVTLSFFVLSTLEIIFIVYFSQINFVLIPTIDTNLMIKILSLLMFNISFFFLIVVILDETTNRIYLSFWWIFNKWVWMFTIFFTIIFSTMFFVKYDRFTLDCNSIYNNLNTLIETFAWPFWINIEDIKVKNNIWKIWDTKIKTFLWLPKNFHISWSNIHDFEDNFNFWDDIFKDISKYYDTKIPYKYNFEIPEKVANMIIVQSRRIDKNANNNELETIRSVWDINSWLLWKINELKDMVISQLLKDKRFIDKGICSFMVEQISERYNKPNFKFSVVLLITILFFPFVRILFFVICLFNYLVFRLLKIIWVFKTIKVTKEVEQID